VKKVFKKDQAMKTLNATESVARGCATWAALLSPAFHVTPYTIEESNYLPIRVEWKFLTPGMEIEPKNSEIFKKGRFIFIKNLQ
jgi:molecular chaperone DnaK (HSP70)